MNTSAVTDSLKITVRNTGGGALGTRSEVPIAAQGSIYFKDVFQVVGIAPSSRAFGPIEMESANRAQMQAVLLIRSIERN